MFLLANSTCVHTWLHKNPKANLLKLLKETIPLPIRYMYLSQPTKCSMHYLMLHVCTQIVVEHVVNFHLPKHRRETNQLVPCTSCSKLLYTPKIKYLKIPHKVLTNLVCILNKEVKEKERESSLRKRELVKGSSRMITFQAQDICNYRIFSLLTLRGL